MVKSRYSPISGKEFLKQLKKFTKIEVISQKGSHIKIFRTDLRKVSIIPDHKELRYGTFSGILEQLAIDEDVFLTFLEV
jgi:predicted RNA binding protein YcfA (HicA-like mRNA interferase family)